MTLAVNLLIELEIPSQNVTEKGRSWRGRYAKTRERRATWHMLCRIAMEIAKVPRATGPRTIKITAFRKQRCKDIANLIGGAKACVDGLVDAGLIQDDSDTKARISYEQRVVSEGPTGKPCTIIGVLVEEMNP